MTPTDTSSSEEPAQREIDLDLAFDPKDWPLPAEAARETDVDSSSDQAPAPAHDQGGQPLPTPQPPAMPSYTFRWSPPPIYRPRVNYKSPYPYPPIIGGDGRWVLYLDSPEGHTASGTWSNNGHPLPGATAARGTMALNIRVKTSTPFIKVFRAYAANKKERVEDLMFYVLTKDQSINGELLDGTGSLMDMNLEAARYVRESARDIFILVIRKDKT